MHRPFPSQGSSAHSFTSVIGDGQRRRVEEVKCNIKFQFHCTCRVCTLSKPWLWRSSTIEASQYVMGQSQQEWSRGCSFSLKREVRNHSVVAVFWTACMLLSGITEQININKRIPFILAHFIKASVTCNVWCWRHACPELITYRATGASGVSMCVFVCRSFTLSVPLLPLSYSMSLSLPLLLTNAVGLQCTELESWFTLTGVASLNRDTFPRATYCGSGGTLVNHWKAKEMCTVITGMR